MQVFNEKFSFCPHFNGNPLCQYVKERCATGAGMSGAPKQGAAYKIQIVVTANGRSIAERLLTKQTRSFTL